MLRPPRRSTLFPYTTLFRSDDDDPNVWDLGFDALDMIDRAAGEPAVRRLRSHPRLRPLATAWLRRRQAVARDRKSTRLNSSHRCISYAVFCLKKKKTREQTA